MSYIEIRNFNSFWKDCGSDPHNSYKDRSGVWRCRKIGRIRCIAKNCPEFKQHIEEAKKLFENAINQASENEEEEAACASKPRGSRG